MLFVCTIAIKRRGGRNCRRDFAQNRKKRDNACHRTHRIDAPNIRLVEEDGTMVGIMPVSEAIKVASERNLDLVEISTPGNELPTCKIMDYGKHCYKQQKKATSSASVRKVKEIKVDNINISDHDLQIKIDHAITFLHNKDSVKAMIILKRRDFDRRDAALTMMKKISQALEKHGKQQEEHIKFYGNRVILTFTPE